MHRVVLPQISSDKPNCSPVLDWLRREGEKLVEQMLAAEVDDVLGRASHARSRSAQPIRRNGYKTRTLKTAEARYRVSLPQLRDGEEPYRSCLWTILRGQCPLLNGLILKLYESGLSVSDLQTFLERACAASPQNLLSTASLASIAASAERDRGWFETRDLRSHLPVCLSLGQMSTRCVRGEAESFCVGFVRCADESTHVLCVARSCDDVQTELRKKLHVLKDRSLPPPLLIGCGSCPSLQAAIGDVWRRQERRGFWHSVLFETKYPLSPQIRSTVREGYAQLV
jgi:hypothetical protein